MLDLWQTNISYEKKFESEVSLWLLSCNLK